MIFLGKFLFQLSLIDEVKALSSFSFLEGAVGLFLGNKSVFLDKNPRWGRVELDFLLIILKKAYVGSLLDGCIHIIDPRSS